MSTTIPAMSPELQEKIKKLGLDAFHDAFNASMDESPLSMLRDDINVKFYTGTQLPRKIVSLQIDAQGAQKRIKQTKNISHFDTLLTFAAKHNLLPMVQELLDPSKNSGISLEGTDDAGNTALHLAAEHGHIEMCRLLISKGANVNARNKKLETPLHHALRCKKTDCQNKTKEEQAAILLKDGIINTKREEIALLLIDNGADVNAKTRVNTSPLHLAAKRNYGKILRRLVMLGADVNAKTFGLLKTPFHIVLQKGDPEMVELFIQKGADKNIRTRTGKYPIHYAVMSGKPGNLSKLLLRRRMFGFMEDVFRLNESTFKTEHLNSAGKSLRKLPARTPMELALMHWDVPMLDHLFQYGAPISSLTDSFHPFYVSKLPQFDPNITPIPFKLIKWLLDHGVDLGAYQAEQIYKAVAGNVPLMDRLLAKKVPIPLSFLQWAFEQNRMDVIKWLFEKTNLSERLRVENPCWFMDQIFGSVLKSNYKVALSYDSDKQIYKLSNKNEANDLLNYLYTQVKVWGIPQLISAAAANENLDVILWLMDLPNASLEPEQGGIDRMPFYNSALYTAARYGRTLTIDYLIRHGAKIAGVASPTGESVLHAAVKKDITTTRLIYRELSKDMKTLHENLNFADSEGNTPLLAAAIAGHDDIVYFLIEEDAAVDVTNKSGENLLTIYLGKGPGHDKMIEFLIHKSKDILTFLDNDNSQTIKPICIAIQTNNVAAVQILGNLGASFTLMARHLAQSLLEKANKYANIMTDAAEVYLAAETLYLAATNQDQDQDTIERSLILLGAGLNFRSLPNYQTILHFTVLNEKQDLAEKILEHIAPLNGTRKFCIINVHDLHDDTPLHLAAENNNEKMMKLLLSYSAAPNIQNEDGNTPLHIAISNSCKAAVYIFLHFIPLPNFDIVNLKGQTILDLAAEKSKVEPNGDAPIIYSLLLCAKLKVLKAPDTTHYGPGALEEFLHKKKLILDALSYQIRTMPNCEERNHILLAVADALADEENPAFDPSLAYFYYDSITELHNNLDIYQQVQNKIISLLMANSEVLKFVKTDSFPKLVVQSDPTEEEENPKVKGLDEPDSDDLSEPNTVVEDKTEKDLKAQKEPLTDDPKQPEVDLKAQRELQRELQMEVFFKHYLKLNAKNREDLDLTKGDLTLAQKDFPFTRIFSTYICDEMQIPKDLKEIGSLVEKVTDVSPDTTLALMQIIRTLLKGRDKTAEERNAVTDEKGNTEDQQIQALIKERDAAIQRAERAEYRLKLMRGETKQDRERQLLARKEAEKLKLPGATSAASVISGTLAAPVTSTITATSAVSAASAISRASAAEQPKLVQFSTSKVPTKSKARGAPVTRGAPEASKAARFL